MADQPPARDRLTLKTGAVAGGHCCPACGGLLAEGTRICPHCSHDLKRGRRSAPYRANRSGGGLLTAISTLLRSMGWLVVTLIAVAAVAVLGTLAYQRWWPAPPASPRPCITCHETGRVTCPTCGGGGQVDGAVIALPCTSCQGSGVLKQKLSKGSRPCPFCQGTGSKGSKTERVACATCAGRGVVTCPHCAGQGRLVPKS